MQDVVSTYADVSGLMNDFGYKPETKLADGIGKWYKKFYNNNGDKNILITGGTGKKYTEIILAK